MDNSNDNRMSGFFKDCAIKRQQTSQGAEVTFRLHNSTELLEQDKRKVQTFVFNHTIQDFSLKLLGRHPVVENKGHDVPVLCSNVTKPLL